MSAMCLLISGSDKFIHDRHMAWLIKSDGKWVKVAKQTNIILLQNPSVMFMLPSQGTSSKQVSSKLISGFQLNIYNY